MIEYPAFKAHLSVKVLRQDLVVVYSGSGHSVLEGRLYALLAELIDGMNSVQDIANQLAGRAGFVEVLWALNELEADGYLVDSADFEFPELAAFRDALSIPPSVFQTRLQTIRVFVRSLGSVRIEPLISALQSMHIRIEEDGEFGLVVVDDYLRNDIADFQDWASEGRRSWMLVKPNGLLAWVGPIFGPESPGCWHCLAERLRANLLPANAEAHRSPPAGSPLTMTCSLQLAAAVTATEALRWIACGGQTELRRLLLAVDSQKMNIERHVFVPPTPRHCCGLAEAATSKPIRLQSRSKSFVSDGGHRSNSPEVIFQQFSHLISPLIGIVRAETHESALNGLVHSYETDHMFSVFHATNSGQERRFSSGKGMTAAQARASALCEALERYSGVFRGDEVRKRASYASLGENAIHPSTLLNFSERQYQLRPVWDRDGLSRDWVPEPFDENKDIDWTPVWSLTKQRAKWVPTAYCYYCHSLATNTAFCRANSNGCAAGSTLEEAVLQGFLELIERDSVAVWWYNRIPRSALNLDNFPQPYLGTLREEYQRLKLDFVVFDITSDFAIPSYAAVASPLKRGEPWDRFMGFGSHLDPVIAVCRAVTEMNQFLAPFLSGARGWLKKTPTDVAFLDSTNSSTADLGIHDKRWADDVKNDVDMCVDQADELGLETLVLDQTRQDVGLSVVRVIVPGLRHFWPRFARGRLYSVPVQMGWLAKSTAEESLNPMHLLI